MILVGVLSVSLFTFCSGVNSSFERSDAILARERPVDGTVVEVVSPLRGGREVRVSYDVNGVSRTTTTVVYDVPALGDVVHLRYDPEDPDVVSDPANDEPVEWPAWTMLAWMGTLFSSLRLFSLWWRSRRARRSR